ncbi:unnamed protein product [Rhizopus stolonifer]
MLPSDAISELLTDWTLAVTNSDITKVQALLKVEPELLWTPIPHSQDDDLERRLVQLEYLGTQFQPLCAVHISILYYNQHKDFKFTSYLIKESTLHDLDTRFWGQCNNTTLHLACFLGNQAMVDLLLERGVSTQTINHLGYLPQDTNPSIHLKQIRTAQSDRFRLLKEIAESSDEHIMGSLNKKTSEHQYFRKGKVKETQQKVLTEEEQTVHTQRKRQLEVAQLVKRSAVKNNPLYQKLEKVSTIKRTRASPIKGMVYDAFEPKNAQAKLKENLPKRLSNTKDLIVDKKSLKEFRNTSDQSNANDEKKEGRAESTDSNSQVEIENKQVDPKEEQEKTGEENRANAEEEKLQAEIKDSNSHVEIEGNNQPKSQVGSKEEQEKTNNEDHVNVEKEEQVEAIVDEDSDNQVEIEKNSQTEIKENSQTELKEEDIQSKRDDGSTEIDANSQPDPKSNMHAIIEERETENYEGYIQVEYEEHIPIEFERGTHTDNCKVIGGDDVDRKTSFVDTSQTESEDESSIEEENKFYESVDDNDHQHLAQRTHEHVKESSKEDDLDSILSTTDDEEDHVIHYVARAVTPVYNPTILTEAALKEESYNLSPSSTTTLTNEDNHLSKLSDDSGVDIEEEEEEIRKNSSKPSKNDQPQSQREMKRRSGSQKAAWSMSMSSWAAILDREFNLSDLNPEMANKANKKVENSSASDMSALDSNSTMDVTLLNSNSNLDDQVLSSNPSLDASKTEVSEMDLSKLEVSETDLSRLQVSQLDLTYSNSNITKSDNPNSEKSITPKPEHIKSVRRKPLPAIAVRAPTQNIEEDNIPQKHHHQNTEPILTPSINYNSSYGKLYLHVNCIQDILLPLPKDRAFVRCVVSDGRFEYMSRYEVLDQTIHFDYECVIDAHPDMIITLSLHVRPDFIMKSRKPFSRLFSSRKKKECLSGYVNKDDGAIGQSRFALAHMVPACNEVTYEAGFSCFNAWYSKSFKERHRQKKKDQDVLKVVGNFNVEMLYLSQSSFQSYPKTLAGYNRHPSSQS